ncbi:MAG: P-loop NTPase [Bosea sp. (in: a-proteobacteria)]|jgi:pilus assembly protein CpaE|uniref:AAA family ATPase n=1 Tax=Bosea sp. (in: a-proteobacteria) TaxID=1871050 RepID=UPI000A8CB0F7|nr:P-loop NTPase [Bosea sp. (in: a-proteobacteria)]MBA4267893.1 CtpF protein [Methylobacterium sp.]MBX9873347.1 P-loop NTPase [Beijerinckiaceae bacterium]MBA4335926.1 CtpF protein [Methylobacterium sp.]MDP3601850.1 P-loop NTPase [Bosea sp. (in: a-proteobacteria)]WRH57069.1 MAG: P-loop NTPase [Bosea sp. (in: a-proteobacteria)]
MNAGEDQGSVSGSAVEDVVAPLPRVTLQAFCETPGVAATMQAAIADRRMDKAHARIHMGGPAAAVEAFRSAPTPNIIVLETVADASSLIGHLDALSESCDAGTKVIVIGHVNDVQLYRDLIRRGVSEYLIAPLGTLDVLKTLSELYVAPGARNLGRIIAVMGAKGGVGSSTVSHNVAWAIARNLDASTVIVDLDIAYGTAGLDFNQDPPQGIAEAVFAPERLDANMLDRLLSRCSDNLALLAAPAMLDRTLDLPEDAFEQLFDLLRATVPCVVLDVPHVWTGWARRALISADEIVVVAGPELASLRNAKNLIDLARANRPNDAGPKLVLNQVGMPKRPEIDAAEFSKALGIDVLTSIPFDAQLFGTAANNGQMIAEVQAGGKIAEAFVHIASSLTGRGEAKRSKRSLFEPLVAKLRRKA